MPFNVKGIVARVEAEPAVMPDLRELNHLFNITQTIPFYTLYREANF
jgi:hypothetical protein